MGKSAPKIRLKGKPIKVFIIRVMLFCLGRAFPSLAKHDPKLQEEIASWHEGFTILFEVQPAGPYMSMRKTNGQLRYVGLVKTQANLTIAVKNIDSALLLFTGMMGTPQAYAEHRCAVKGDISEALRLIRCLNVVLHYLFPAFIARKVMKRLPATQLGRLFTGRARAYLLGVPFNV